MGFRASAAIAAALLTIAAGCGGDNNGGGATQPATTPVTGAGVKLTPIGGADFGEPVYVTQPPGNSTDLYVVDRTGKVEIVRNGKKLPTPFLDISPKVSADVEQGFLSIAFAPDYQSSGLFYAYYTGLDGKQNVVEFKRSAGNPDVADQGSEREVLKMADFAPNHNGGLLLFGTDGHLYIGTGDGGGAGGGDPHRNAQNLGSLLGKILRIDPGRSGNQPYTVPADNPFAGRAAARPEIYSYGLRNPWRFSFDSATNALYIGDVGQDKWEEVDAVPSGKGAGANFGWSAFEGDARFNSDQSAAGAIKPVLVYSHDAGCAVNGGYVVHDPALPSLAGRYLYSDFCSGDIRSFKLEGRKAIGDSTTGLHTQSPTSFGTDNAGHIYVTSLNGPVFQIVPSK